MIDIKLKNNTQVSGYDIALSGDDIEKENGLESAIIISLFTDMRVNGERGFWGDSLAGESWGSKLWTLSREKLTEQTRIKFENYVKESLQWLIKDKIASSLSVKSEINYPDSIFLELSIIKPNDSALGFKFNILWNE